jgi:hypothetical protein
MESYCIKQQYTSPAKNYKPSVDRELQRGLRIAPHPIASSGGHSRPSRRIHRARCNTARASCWHRADTALQSPCHQDVLEDPRLSTSLGGCGREPPSSVGPAPTRSRMRPSMDAPQRGVCSSRGFASELRGPCRFGAGHLAIEGASLFLSCTRYLGSLCPHHRAPFPFT